MVYFTAERIGPVLSDLRVTKTFTKYTELSTQNQTYIQYISLNIRHSLMRGELSMTKGSDF